ncbi:myocardin-related transcription factor B isoform X2 [Genypterus blacodes]|uniref:myocardin-related transcription factor B isoform X2 n=1 Tax=Genypterus blacodes TaxID=154954 RepID=UPI003F774A4C
MGFQTWQPSEPPLSSMACLDVETPSICRGKFKSVLQLRLQQRRSREQLAEQGIMPPLKTPASFHEQIRNLERARTGNFLKHKLCSRPERSELVRMHILQETHAEPSLQATQMKLKKARLTDDLNEKISQRPGPMELVEKNILPVDTEVKEVIEEKVTQPKKLDVYNFDEDSCGASSPNRPSSQESHSSSSSASPKDGAGVEATPTTPSRLNSPMQPSPPNSLPASDLVNLVCPVSEQQGNRQIPRPMAAAPAAPTAGTVLLKQSQPKTLSDKSRSKKSKEAKPRVKKLKYHQYIPPDQKQEPNDLPMNSAYARLLQQQQQFLQLQILSQQQQRYSYQAVLPAPLRSANEGQTSCSAITLSRNAASSPHLVSLAPVRPRHAETNRKPHHLPANLDEMKVAELKMELKLRSLPVSGTKTDLIERLKMYQENSNMQTATAVEIGATPSERLTPPVSPVVSKVSSMGLEEGGTAESPAKLSDAAPCKSSLQRSLQEDTPAEARLPEKDSEKDKRLHEKERQIKELMRKLEQEQRLVEELKMQLEVEKRSQQGDSPPRLSPHPALIQVKQENWTSTNCSASCGSPCLPVVVKQEEGADQSHLAPPHHFIIHQQLPQTLNQSETLQGIQTGAQILLPPSHSASAATIQLPSSGFRLHTTVSSVAAGLIQTPGQMPQKTESSATLQQQCSTQTQPMTKTPRKEAQHLLNTLSARECPAGGASTQADPTGPTNKQALCPTQSALMLQQPKCTDVSKCKDPPPYEDAIKQSRSMLTTAQGPTAASQHMDDLFEVLIESGEMSPFVRQDPHTLDKHLPVTASVTTLPINTVLSRPPALVQTAQLPAAPHNPSTTLVALETLLDATLGVDSEPQTLKLMEELHCHYDNMEVDLNTAPSNLNPQNHVDNMDWLDLTMSVSAEAVGALGTSSPAGVFSSVFLDAHELTLNWD